MGLFNLFKKKQPEQQPGINEAADYTRTQMQQDASLAGRNFVSDLVNYFSSNKYITDAWFGYVPLQNAPQPLLFLSLGLTAGADEEAIKATTWFIKQTHFPEGLQLATSTSHANVYEFINERNFAFYTAGSNTTLEQAVMKQWFQPERFKQEFIDTLKHSRPVTLIKDLDMNSNIMHFQTFVRNSGEFIPLFTGKEMVAKSGMTEVPPNLTVMEFDFEKINELLGYALNNNFFVLNPGTAFEVEFYA